MFNPFKLEHCFLHGIDYDVTIFKVCPDCEDQCEPENEEGE